MGPVYFNYQLLKSLLWGVDIFLWNKLYTLFNSLLLMV